MPQPVAFDFHKPRITAFSELSNRFGKITCNVLISDWLQGPATLESESDPHVAMFRSMDRCFRTLAAWYRRDDRRRAGPRVLPRRVDGAVILVSLGGIFVELLKDAAVELAPVNDAEARGMLDRLRGAALFHGFRGAPPVDLEHLSDVIGRLSEFAADHQDRIAELDVNPLICSENRIVAADALIVRRSAIQ